MARGTFLSSLEEKVTITGIRDGVNIVVEQNQCIIILEETRQKFDTERGVLVQESGYYIGNICEPNYQICVNDLITRQPRNSADPRGSSEYLQVLIVEDIRVIGNKQQLQLVDNKKVQ